MNETPFVKNIKKKLFPFVEGNVLETAVGYSSNLEFYDPKNVKKIIGVDYL